MVFLHQVRVQHAGKLRLPNADPTLGAEPDAQDSSTAPSCLLSTPGVTGSFPWSAPAFAPASLVRPCLRPCLPGPPLPSPLPPAATQPQGLTRTSTAARRPGLLEVEAIS